MPRSEKKQEIAKWEASIPSFTSVYKYYERAIQDLMIDSLNPHAIDVVKAPTKAPIKTAITIG